MSDEKLVNKIIYLELALISAKDENAELKAKIEKVSGDALSNYYENLELKAEVEHYKNQLNLVCEEGLTPADAKKSHEANSGLAEENTQLRARIDELESDIKNNKGGVFAYDANGEAWVRLGFKIVKDSEVGS